MNRKEKLLTSLLLVGVLGSLAAAGVFGAFSSTTTNPDNSFSAGTVEIADNDSNQALYSASDQKPGDSVTSCIRVTYSGSLDAEVRLYTPSTIGDLGPHVDLTITPGTQAAATFPDCTGFTADVGGAIFDGTLASFSAAHNSYANGMEFNPDAGTGWAQNDEVVYRFQVTLDTNAPDSAQGDSTGTHAYEWQARNQ